MNKIFSKLKADLEEVGGSLDLYDSFFVCDSPRGYIWKENGLTSLTEPYANSGGQTWAVSAVKEARKLLGQGLDKVTDPEQLEEVRYSLDDDSWNAPEGSPDFISFPKIKR